MWESESESAATHKYGGGLLTSTNHGVKTEGFVQRGHSWYVATDIPSDFLVQIGEANFHLHKYPLVSRSGKLSRVIYESHDPDLNKIVMDDIPGGEEAFELAAKFCYGIAVDLTAGNISGLRCAAEYLEMTEDLEEGNLIFKAEAFLSYVVLSSWRDSIVVLKSCEKLSPWAENLQIVRRCSESIAWKACANPKGIRWSYTGRTAKISSPKWNDMKDSSPSRNQQVPPDWWFEDASILRIDHFVRVITAIKVKGMRFELVGASIMHYATKWLPGLISDTATPGDEASNCSMSNSSSSGGGSWKSGLHMVVTGTKDDNTSSLQAKEQRMIIESLVSIIPPQKDSVSCSFLLRLLRMAIMLKVAPALVTELEKRVGMQFEQATLADLLIPSYNKGETMYDVDLVQRLLEHFIVQEQTESSSPSRNSFSDKQHMGMGMGMGCILNAKARVARLVDSYLTEVSRDRNLSLTKFQVLAEALPESARTCDDGLYRAIDSYLKLISGSVRYKGGHAIIHWKETHHCYSLEVETKPVWDYVGDNYVHRLIQSKTDGKLVELNTRCAHADNECGSCSCEDNAMNEAILNSKLEASFESLLQEVKEESERKISKAVQKAISLKQQKIQSKIDRCKKEKKFLDDLNENLVKNEDIWKTKILAIEEREL
ncbi:Root phototropism protein 3 [Glycine max]|nr:Root phototropism protein 3 [Glycine max]